MKGGSEQEGPQQKAKKQCSGRWSQGLNYSLPLSQSQNHKIEYHSVHFHANLTPKFILLLIFLRLIFI